eukprot:14658002-Alexandrium_andersonii.AAC.1
MCIRDRAWAALISGPALNHWTLVCITGPEIPGLASEGSSPATSGVDQGETAQRQPGQSDQHYPRAPEVEWPPGAPAW